jgi:hypothetical protein
MSEDLVVVYYVEADFGWDPAIGKSKCTVKFSFATRVSGTGKVSDLNITSLAICSLPRP